MKVWLWEEKLVYDNAKDIVQTHDIFDTVCDIIHHNNYNNNINSFFRRKRKMALSELFMPSEYDYFLKKCKSLNHAFDSSKFVEAGMHNQKAYIEGEFKLIIRDGHKNELYKFKDDIDEKQNLIGINNPLYNDFVNSALQKARLQNTPTKKPLGVTPVTRSVLDWTRRQG